MLASLPLARRALHALAPLLAASLSFPAAAAELSGTVALMEHGQPAGDVVNAVVYYEPAGGAKAGPAARPLEITTREKHFLPRVLPVPAGSAVRFPNQDPILHNVFSVSPGNRFDLGRYREGPGKSAKFEKPGLVRVYCNVHQAMVAYVLVLDTPYYTTPDAEGRFSLSGLPEGRGTLTVWHERSGAVRREVEVPAAGPISIEVEATVIRLPPHLNKFGRPYGSDDTGEDYK